MENETQNVDQPAESSSIIMLQSRSNQDSVKQFADKLPAVTSATMAHNLTMQLATPRIQLIVDTVVAGLRDLWIDQP